MNIPISQQLNTNDLQEGKDYACFNAQQEWNSDEEYHQDGIIFKYIGDGHAMVYELSQGEGEEYCHINSLQADFFVLQN